MALAIIVLAPGRTHGTPVAPVANWPDGVTFPTVAIALRAGSVAGAIRITGYSAPNIAITPTAPDSNGRELTLMAGDVLELQAAGGGGGPVETTDPQSFKVFAVASSITNVTVATPPTSLDAVFFAEGDRILLLNQTDGKQNGLWVFHEGGGALTRPADYLTGATDQAFLGMTVPVTSGTLRGGTRWQIGTAGPITIDTTATAWVILTVNLYNGSVTGLLPAAHMGAIPVAQVTDATSQVVATSSVTGVATLTAADMGTEVVCSGTSANYPLTLPNATLAGVTGRSVTIRMSGALTKLVTLTGASAQTIDGAATRVMWAGEVAKLESDGSNWVKIAGRSIAMVAQMSLSAPQAIAGDSALHAIAWDTTEHDNTGLMCDPTTNHRVNFVRAGRYQVNSNMLITGAADSSNLATLAANGVTAAALYYLATVPGNSGFVSTAGGAVRAFAAGDYLAVAMTSSSAVSAYGEAGGQASLISAVELPQW